MRIRIFGSRYCDTCLNLCADLKGLDVKYKWIDADDDENQNLCNEHDVDYLPHIQIFNEKKVFFNHSGPLLAADLKLIYDRINKNEMRSKNTRRN